MINVKLEPLRDDDRDQFIIDTQEAFNYGAMEEFGRRDDLYRNWVCEGILDVSDGSLRERIFAERGQCG